MAELIRTVRCKLEVDPQQALVLHETMTRFAAACQDIHRLEIGPKVVRRLRAEVIHKPDRVLCRID